ncbi:murein biosynthesis integral membrane protein MurJ [Pedosphaera parvula]|nr:murein biosynthesis integral membrane protein MurJ [Pedosphaera parvula]
MLKSSGAMAAATMTSRLLGMVREMVYARFMADGWEAGAFQLAFMVPNLFRRLLGEGALTASFIPIFKEKEKTTSEAEMWRAANAVISALIIASSVIIGLGILVVSLMLKRGHLSPQTDLMLHLLRWMFPYVLLVCLTAIFMGILNARGHFFIPAIGAAVLNVVMIASVFFLAPHMGEKLHQQIYALAIGVLAAGIAQAAFQLPSLHAEGFRYIWVSPWRDETVRRVIRQMVPATIGVAAFQINVLMTQGMAFWVDPSIVASFQYAVRLMELPQGVFGVSLATYLLPTLSGLAAEKKYPEFKSTLNQGLDHLIFINLLAGIFLFFLAEPMIRLLFEHGKFGPESTGRVSLALVCLAPGLVAFSMNNIMARAFYALGDIRSPMKISIFCLALNLIFAVVLIKSFKQAGLGLANTLSAGCNVFLLFYALRRKLGALELNSLRQILGATLGAAAVAALATWGLSRIWEEHIGHVGVLRRIGAVFVPMTVASILYWGVALWFKVPPAMEMGGMIFKKLLRRK